MILLAHVFKKLIKEWNKRPLTEKDFFKLCKKFKVLVIEDGSNNMVGRGMYMVIEGIPTIFINSRLTGLERLWTMFHELGHHLLHTPETCFFSDSIHHKDQHEANIFAAIALIPENVARQRPLWNLYDLDEFAARLFEIRLEVFDLYKM
jgi:Zn-dependent peptidase ImmA (M78 family)